jgi:phospholipid N-methyltransferase
MTRFSFFIEGIKNLKTTGTITRSSRYVCRKMVEDVDFSNAKCIVELGGGDGVVTKHILKRLQGDTKLITFEILPQFCEMLRELDDERLIVAEDSAENIQQHLKAHGFQQADYVISTLPIVNIPEDIALRIVRAAKDSLKPNGLYVQLHYSLLVKSLYEKVFGNVAVKFVVRNVPPAFILRSRKR